MDVTAIVKGLAGFFTSRCTIQDRLRGRDDFGADVGRWTDIIALSNLLCMDANVDHSGLAVGDSAGTVAATGFLLLGYYPAIVIGQRAVVDGVPFVIDGVELKSKALTRLTVSRVI